MKKTVQIGEKIYEVTVLKSKKELPRNRIYIGSQEQLHANAPQNSFLDVYECVDEYFGVYTNNVAYVGGSITDPTPSHFNH